MIGLGSVELASKFLRGIINRIGELLDAIAVQNFTWENASSDQAAVLIIHLGFLFCSVDQAPALNGL
jgi:hypothetical protein